MQSEIPSFINLHNTLAAFCFFNIGKYRFQWGLYLPEERAENDGRRTSAHNAFMDAVNIYVRYMNSVRGTALEGIKPRRPCGGMRMPCIHA